MKALALILAIISPLAYAQSAHQTCDELATVAQRIMELRQNSEPFQSTMYRVRESDQLRLVVLDAYTVPVFFWHDDKKREKVKFGDYWYRKCMKDYQEKPVDIWDR